MSLYPFNPNIQMGWVKTYQIRWVMGGFMDMDKICHPYSQGMDAGKPHTQWSQNPSWELGPETIHIELTLISGI